MAGQAGRAELVDCVFGVGSGMMLGLTDEGVAGSVKQMSMERCCIEGKVKGG
jgi:hypothetical protein